MTDDELYDLVDGNGNPPYTLYHDEDDNWGLIDKDGTRLPTMYWRRDDGSFYLEELETFVFDPMEGFVYKESDYQVSIRDEFLSDDDILT